MLLALVMALFVLLVVAMVVGWMRRRRRQAYLGRPLAVPAAVGTLVGRFTGLYVSTTFDGRPLDRVAVPGLGFRSRATIDVTDAGVVLALRGTAPAFIPVSDIRDVTRAQYTIDRVVETGGLVLLGWSVGGTAVDSYFRLDEPEPLLAALESIIPTSSGKKA
ncbi:hypothetical protein [Galbitalea soli]|uniref:PH domain-containing protein n=1 Tax=Galbitalea soli TaxID=1268042 RepID=A0A7C9PLQ8_9MICO|nr:hypothetical protein [Galbitalea soli]NEM90211.1 hypothetical protein [Galbitalea soli]NYJ30919.1 hypothetical protein [Galbitalea soli]